MKGIKDIQFSREINGLAVSIPDKGVILINPDRWGKLPYEERLYVLLHEYGHIKGKTFNEFEADEIAFKHYVKMGLDPDGAVRALEALKKNGRWVNPEHKQRAMIQIQRVNKHKQSKGIAAYQGCQVASFAGGMAALQSLGFISQGLASILTADENLEATKAQAGASIENARAQVSIAQMAAENKKSLIIAAVLITLIIAAAIVFK
mgnify:CR=1 FL=1